MSKSNCCQDDMLSRVLCKFGVDRGMLITLALLPFAWDGVVWCGQAIESLWSLVSGAVN